MAAIAEVSEGSEGLELADAAFMDAGTVLASLGTSECGLVESEASRRLHAVGPNAVLSHGARPLRVLLRQLRNPLLILLAGAALVSILVGERADALIILVIVCLSVGLGFVNEYRSEKAVEELHSSIRHTAVTARAGRISAVDVTELVPGDVVGLGIGEVVPADIRLLEATRPCSPASPCPRRREPNPPRDRIPP
jgi:Mg2+-importing ATPase